MQSLDEGVLFISPFFVRKMITCFVTMQIQRKLQIQIENQGKHLQMMFEQQIKSGEPSAPSSSAALPSPVENLDTSANEGHEKIGINYSTQDTSAKQKGDDAKVSDELDQLSTPPTKRVKTD